MNFAQRDEGDYLIYAGAMECAQGNGYIAAVVISRVRGMLHVPREAYRDENLAGGYRWASPDEAIAYALLRARMLIRAPGDRLEC